jgi:hypothetical protein
MNFSATPLHSDACVQPGSMNDLVPLKHLKLIDKLHNSWLTSSAVRKLNNAHDIIVAIALKLHTAW